ncbi:MAG: helix-turn-helix domain-containing protein [Thaumarchaeota archaeon]|nr:helix-turn-helix domain-containing protein [Nitrososphaerota archaeon]
MLLVATPKFIADGTAESMMHPARFKILQYLREKNEPQFVDQIAKATGVHPRLVSHHLDVLEEKGLTASKYEISNSDGAKRGVAVRMCWALPKAEDVLRVVRESSK